MRRKSPWTTAGGAVLGGARFWAGLLLVAVFLVGLGLAGAALIAFEYLTGAGLSVACRRVPEAMTAFLRLGGMGIALVLLMYPSLYPWTALHGEEMVGFRGFWLNRGFFLARAAGYLAVWIIFARALVRHSRQQDRTGDAQLRHRNAAWSGVFVVLFALTCWLASVDWLMTLEPEWFSKERIGTALGMFGVGNAGAAATAMFAPLVLRRITAENLEGWRMLPKLYAGLLIATALLFWFTTKDRRAAGLGRRPARTSRDVRFVVCWSRFLRAAVSRRNGDPYAGRGNHCRREGGGDQRLSARNPTF
jgi:hypothetical protein